MRAVRPVLLTLLAMILTAPAALFAQDEEPYGGTPDELTPFRNAGEPARRFLVTAPEFRGPGRDEPAPEGLREVALGMIAPLRGVDAPAGLAMQNAARLALDEANADGGFGDGRLPFRLHVRDEGASWGAAGDAGVELVHEQGVWAILGGYEDTNSHVLTRVLLKLEVPNVNATGVDPTLTEHNIPWLVRVRPDDRQSSYRLARKVFEEDGRERVVLFRANSRYGRTGTKEFQDAARRLGKPVLLETRYESGYHEGADDIATQLRRIAALTPDAVVVWGRPAATGEAVRALRKAGIDCAVYGPDRVAAPAFLAAAGDAAEGFVFTYPLDPRRDDEPWTTFSSRYRERFGTDPTPEAAFTYDATRILVDAVRRAGLNRARIRDALYEPRTVEGVSGTIRLDATRNNVTPVILGHVEKGRFVFDG